MLFYPNCPLSSCLSHFPFVPHHASGSSPVPGSAGINVGLHWPRQRLFQGSLPPGPSPTHLSALGENVAQAKAYLATPGLCTGKGLSAEFQPAVSAQMSFPCSTPRLRKTWIFPHGIWWPDKEKKLKSFATKGWKKSWKLMLAANTLRATSQLSIWLILTGAFQARISDGPTLSVYQKGMISTLRRKS